MTAIRAPRSIEAATRLLEAFASLEGDIADIEANRAACIADVNARCDTAANALIERREQIREKLQPWWADNADELTQGKRKSIELGGCMIGSRAGRAALTIARKEQDVVEVLRTLRWAKPFLRVKTMLDRAAVMKSIDGRHSVTFAELGITRTEGDETFFVERAEQEGTRSG